MDTFILDAAEVLQTFRGTEYRMIDLRITCVNGRFEHRSLPFKVAVSNESQRVEAFFVLLSPDGKAMHGYFTTDAFTVFTGSVDVSFGYLGQPIGNITDISISAAPLPSYLAAIGAPNANNTWLADLT
jgi:hypothetical protein